MNGQHVKNFAIWPVPPVMAALFALAGYGLNRIAPLVPVPYVPSESVAAGSVLIVVAVTIAGLAVREMARAQTAVLPGANANALVATGVFARSRNPIYLAFILILIGIGIATANAWMIIMAACLAVYLTARVIRREERYLQSRFGPQYADYRKRVRRWF